MRVTVEGSGPAPVREEERINRRGETAAQELREPSVVRRGP
jgi:hypothetical protein